MYVISRALLIVGDSVNAFALYALINRISIVVNLHCFCFVLNFDFVIITKSSQSNNFSV